MNSSAAVVAVPDDGAASGDDLASVADGEAGARRVLRILASELDLIEKVPDERVKQDVLELKEKKFKNGELEVPVLNGIDLEIRAGEFVAIMGASGSGKSTLMNILGCLDRPSAGRYLFNGQDVSALGRDELARLRREAFGFVFQSYNLIPGATALRNVEVPAIYAGMPAAERRARAERLLRTLGLGERLEHRPSQLSGGQQQRVSIARALMNGGRIILADEPTGALDSKSGREVMALLRELSASGQALFVALTYGLGGGRGLLAATLELVGDGRLDEDLEGRVAHRIEPRAHAAPPHRLLHRVARRAPLTRDADRVELVVRVLGAALGMGWVMAPARHLRASQADGGPYPLKRGRLRFATLDGR